VISLSASEQQVFGGSGAAPEPPEEERPLREPAPPDAPTAISIQDLSVTYRAAFEARPTLRSRFMRLGRRQLNYREIEAVKNVSFDIPRGSVTGIIGVNGAGKSTMMRAVAGILPPTAGRIEVHGRVSTLLALGIGFNSELSGKENVVLGGLAAGLSRDQLAAKYDEIAEFAELGDFMDLPMRTYSSGMYGRLAFSVAVNMDPDILLVDEALSVGDARFKRKSLRRMRQLCRKAGTIVIVSHALGTIRNLCTDVAWMHKGELMMFDKAPVVIEAYQEFMEVGEGEDSAEEDL
jgi:lipopolysaccharide transport system ATP-binding protein/teichoic acid transport system ATP-binding protein